MAQAERCIGVADVKKNLSQIVQSVQNGSDPVIIMRYGKPAAMIVPVPNESRMVPSHGGMLRKYADPAKRELENGAWEREAVLNEISA